MLKKYREWISENVQNAYGKCAEVTNEMAVAFPELVRVRGHYYCWVWGERSHWWLVDENGSIVDPTAEQFPSKGNGEYVQWIDGTPEPTGKCANCGNLVYNGDTCCSEICSAEYVRFCCGF